MENLTENIYRAVAGRAAQAEMETKAAAAAAATAAAVAEKRKISVEKNG